MKTFLPGILFILAIGAVHAQDSPFTQPFFEQDTLYSMTPTDDGQQGFHLWVWKPSFESNMPVKKFDYSEDTMNQDPLDKNHNAIPKLEEMIPEDKMPNPIKKAPDQPGLPEQK